MELETPAHLNRAYRVSVILLNYVWNAVEGAGGAGKLTFGLIRLANPQFPLQNRAGFAFRPSLPVVWAMRKNPRLGGSPVGLSLPSPMYSLVLFLRCR